MTYVIKTNDSTALPTIFNKSVIGSTKTNNIQTENKGTYLNFKFENFYFRCFNLHVLQDFIILFY